jgi:RNA polymerase I-specific transcription initiation factor RRN6
MLDASQAVQSLSSRHDPTFGDLIAFGRAADLENQKSGIRSIPVAATVGGENGEQLRLVPVQEHGIAWEASSGMALGDLTLDTNGAGLWFGDGSPIRQVRFAEGEIERNCTFDFSHVSSNVIWSMAD